MKTQIYLKGIDQLERNLNKVLKEVSAEKREILLTEAKKIRDALRERAPLGPTGNLKKAMYATALPERVGAPAVAFAGVRPRRAPHAHLVEFGHGGPHPAPPHPFIRNTIDEMLPQAKQNIAEALKKTIEGAV